MDPAPSKSDIKYPLRWIFLPFLGISIGFLAIIVFATRHAPSDTAKFPATSSACPTISPDSLSHPK